VATLKEVLAARIPAERQRAKDFIKQHGTKVVDHVAIEQIYGGMRGISCLLCDTSSVPADKGLIIRGRPIAELAGLLPEETFWLLLTGELPDKAGLAALQSELTARAQVPEYVWRVLDAMPANAHPMALYNTAMLCMEGESIFHKRYNEGLRKDDFWDATYEDCLTIIARAPAIAAGIYRKRFNKGPRVKDAGGADWAANYVRLLGLPDPKGELVKLMRLYLVLHCDHENGNVSAMTTYTVNSALSDMYYAYSAGMNGLAGPLHGLANQEGLNWVLEAMTKFGGAPTHGQMKAYAAETLNAGKVIPGYGHGVLRVTDPRFECFYEFGRKHCPDDPVFKTVITIFETVPEVLKQVHKIKNPWPNVDAVSGSLLHHYGLTESIYYTVLFGVSRSLGVSAQSIWARALGVPIVRPKSVTSRWLEQQANASMMNPPSQSI
jgi:citrate synthase